MPSDMIKGYFISSFARPSPINPFLHILPVVPPPPFKYARACLPADHVAHF